MIEWSYPVGIMLVLLLLAFMNYRPAKQQAVSTGNVLTCSTFLCRYDDIRRQVPHEMPTKAFLQSSLEAVAELLWSAGTDFDQKPVEAFLIYREKRLVSLVYHLPQLHQDQDATFWEHPYSATGETRLQPGRMSQLEQSPVVMSFHRIRQKDLPDPRYDRTEPKDLIVFAHGGHTYHMSVWFSYRP